MKSLATKGYPFLPTQKALVAGAGVLIALLLLSRYLAHRPAFSWLEEDRAVYRVALYEATRINPEFGLSSRMVTRSLSGQWNMRVLTVGGEEIRLALQLISEVRLNGTRSLLMEKDFGQLFFADIARDGTFLRFHFPPSLSPDSQAELAGIVRGFQAILSPPNPAFWPWDGWMNEEIDSQGVYTASYKTTADFIHKEKKQYTQLRQPEHQNEGLTATVEQASMRFVPDKASWLATAVGREKIVFLKGDQTAFVTENERRLHRANLQPDLSLAIWQEDLDFDTVLEQWQKQPQEKRTLIERQEYAILAKRYQADDIHKALAQFHLGGKQMVPYERLQELIQIITLYPEKSVLIAEMVVGKDYNSKEKDSLIMALQLCGHTEAQAALVMIASEARFEPVDRLRAIMALGMIAAPTTESVAALWDLYESRSEKSLVESSNTSILSLGALYEVTRPDIALGQEKSPVHDLIASRLQEEFDRTDVDPVHRTILISTMGNTGDTAFLEKISDYLRSPHAGWRNAAASALSSFRTSDNKVQQILANHLAEEKVARVRTTTVMSLNRLAPDEHALSMCAQNLVNESDATVRRAYIKYLSRHKGSPHINTTETFREALKRETNATNRNILYKVIYSPSSK